MATPEMNDSGQETTPIAWGRAASTTSSTGNSVHSGVSFDPVGLPSRVLLMPQLPLTTLPIVPISCSPHCAPGEKKGWPNTSPDRNVRLFFKGRTRAEEKRLKTTAQTGLVSVEEELDIVQYVEETFLERAGRWTLTHQSRCRPGRFNQDFRRHSIRRLNIFRRLSLMCCLMYNVSRLCTKKMYQNVGKFSGLDGCTRTR